MSPSSSDNNNKNHSTFIDPLLDCLVIMAELNQRPYSRIRYTLAFLWLTINSLLNYLSVLPVVWVLPVDWFLDP